MNVNLTSSGRLSLHFTLRACFLLSTRKSRDYLAARVAVLAIKRKRALEHMGARKRKKGKRETKKSIAHARKDLSLGPRAARWTRVTAARNRSVVSTCKRMQLFRSRIRCSLIRLVAAARSWKRDTLELSCERANNLLNCTRLHSTPLDSTRLVANRLTGCTSGTIIIIRLLARLRAPPFAYSLLSAKARTQMADADRKRAAILSGSRARACH